MLTFKELPKLDLPLFIYLFVFYQDMQGMVARIFQAILLIGKTKGAKGRKQHLAKPT